jgi:C4-dicarboxylate transporter DctM subunit
MGIISIFILFLLMIVGIPVFVSMGLSAFIGFLLVEEPLQVLKSFSQLNWQGSNTFELVAIPLFILTGTLMQKIDAGRDLFDVTKVWIGSIPNSLGVTTIIACGIFAAISGSSIATAATVGMVAIPLLLQEKYTSHQAGGFTAGGGTLGIIIPPSIPMILYGITTDTSIGKLFMAGIIPGIIMLLLFSLYIMLFSRPKIIVSRDISWKLRWETTRRGIGVLLLPILIIVAIYTGLFTPTEVGALSVIYIMILGFIQRRLTLRKITDAGFSASGTTTMIFMLVVFGKYFAHFLTYEQLPQNIANWVATFESNPLLTITLMTVVYLILGMFLESAAMLLVTIPIFFPISQLIGMDPIVFGVFSCIAMEIAQISPPIGINLFTIHGISKIPLLQLARGVVPFMLIQIIMLYAVYFFPELSLWIPQHMMSR